MEHDEGDLAAAALFTAASNMFSFMLAALQLALKQERAGGFTADGLQIEPPIAHIVRRALAAFIAEHQTVGDPDLSPEQAALANRHYMAHLQLLQQEVLDALRPFEI